MRPLSIVHTESSLGWGGQEIRVLSEARGLSRRGHDVRLLCPPESAICRRAQEWGVPAVPMPIAKKRPLGLKHVHEWLRVNPPHVVNTHSSTDSWLVALALLALGRTVPLVRTRHVSVPISRGPLTRWLYRRASARVVTTGEALREQVIAATGISPLRVVSVPTGVDLARFSPGDRAAARRRLSLPPEDFLVGIVATLRSWKGHSYLVDALAKIEDPATRLVIVGQGPGWEPLHKQVRSRGIEQRVVFAGDQSDVAPWMQALDVFALPSYANEGVPQALQQAMACGLPVLTTRMGAIPEIVQDGVTGIFVAPKDAKALRAAIEALRADSDLARRLGQAGRLEAVARFSEEKMLDAMEALFSSVAGRGA